MLNDFYRATADLSGLFLGLWWAVVGLKGAAWRAEPRRHQLLVYVAAQLLAPAVMSLFSLLSGVGQTGLLWRVSFLVVAALGLVQSLRFLAVDAVPVACWSLLQWLRLATPALYAAIMVVALAPDALLPQPLQVEGVLITLVLVNAAPFIWCTLLDPPGTEQAG